MPPKVPQIEATKSVPSQTGNLPATPVFTPSSDGVFRVNIYMGVINGVKNSSVTMILRWHDHSGPVQNNNQIVASGPGPIGPPVASPATQSLPLFAVAGNPITIETTATAGAVYDVQIVVESL